MMQDEPFVYHNPGDIVAKDRGWWWYDPSLHDLDYGPYPNSAAAARAMHNMERKVHGVKQPYDEEPHPWGATGRQARAQPHG